MHRESITDALLGTVLAFNTVLEIPAGTSLLGADIRCRSDIPGSLQYVRAGRKWEENKKARRAATRVGNK